MKRRWLVALGLTFQLGACVALVEPLPADKELAACIDQHADIPPDTQIENCTHIIDTKPSSSILLALAYSSRGEAWSDKKDYPRALADYDKAVGLEPKTAGLVYTRRGLVRSSAGDKAGAMADMDKALSLDPKNGSVRFMRGIYFLNQHENDRAVAEFTESLRLEPDPAEASTSLLARGRAYMRMKDHASALADFERYVALVPKDDLGFYWRATAHYELGDLDAAMKDFDEAIRLDPDDAGNFNGRSFVWRNMGDDDKALADVDTAARLDPGYFDYQHNKCSLRLHLGREIETALSACDAALRISPRNHDTLSSRGIAYLLLDKPQEAKADFEACTQKLAARPEAERDEDNDRDVAFCRYGRAIATGRIEGGRNGPNGNQISEDMRTAFGLSPGVVSTFDAYGIVR